MSTFGSSESICLAEQVHFLGLASHPHIPLGLHIQTLVLLKHIVQSYLRWGSYQAAENIQIKKECKIAANL